MDASGVLRHPLSSLRVLKVLFPVMPTALLLTPPMNKSARMEQHLKLQLQSRKEKALTLEARLQQHSPIHQLKLQQTQLNYLQHRLQQSLQSRFDHLQQKLSKLALGMDAFSPLATLGRGYSLVKNDQDELIKSTAQLKTGQQVRVYFSETRALMTVDQLDTH